jgi:hypothetical protein
MKNAGASPAFRYSAAATAFVLFFGWFAFGIEQIGMASQYVDPVSHIASQDEAVYAHEAIAMATGGGWLTPVYLSRYALNKPPLLQWLSALAVKVFGIFAWSVRLPSLIAASLTGVLVLLATWRIHSLPVAVTAALLLASSHLFYVFSRLAMTDMLMTLWVTAAMLTVWCDPPLKRTSSALAFGLFTGAAILSKAAAGLLPFLALAIFSAIAPRELRPRWQRFAVALVAAFLISAPWHLYQFIAHPHWFDAEYILTQHLAVGLAAPPQYSNENHLVFYARRMFLMDPVLTLAGLAAIPFVLWQWRKEPVLVAWLAAVVLVLFGFRYRSGYYLLPLLPVLAVMAASLLARASRIPRLPVLAGLLACLVAKVSSGSQVWGIPTAPSHVAIARPLERYCEKHRSNGLVVVGSDDQFYASDLPLAGLRYCLLESPRPSGARRPPLDFAWLGINVSVPEFQQLPGLLPVYRERLAAFDLPSDAPVGTVISARSPEEIGELITSHPELDFWLSAAMLRGLAVTVPQDVELASSGGVFLLARQSGTFPVARSCRL